jgi:hypothetical protein
MSNTINKTDTYNEFLIALEIGQRFEKYAIDKLKERFKLKLCFTNDNYMYDFVLSDGMAYEVKSDIMASKTGNVYIEKHNRNKHSGINITESDYYIIVIKKPSTEYIKIINDEFVLDVSECDKYNYYVIKTDTIKMLINTNQYKTISVDNLKSGYLFDIYVIKTHSEAIL